MARMHSRRKGKSGSKKPAKLKAPWVKYTPEEIETITLKLSKQGLPPARIGLVLRDQYGIPTVRINDSKLQSILRKNNVSSQIPEDIFSLLKKSVNLHEHMGRNKKDYTSKRGLELTESKIRRLAKFHIRNKTLPAGWKYDIDKAKLLVK